MPILFQFSMYSQILRSQVIYDGMENLGLSLV